MVCQLSIGGLAGWMHSRSMHGLFPVEWIYTQRVIIAANFARQDGAIYESLFALTVQQWIQCNTIQYVKGKYRHSVVKVRNKEHAKKETRREKLSYTVKQNGWKWKTTSKLLSKVTKSSADIGRHTRDKTIRDYRLLIVHLPLHAATHAACMTRTDNEYFAATPAKQYRNRL